MLTPGSNKHHDNKPFEINYKLLYNSWISAFDKERSPSCYDGFIDVDKTDYPEEYGTYLERISSLDDIKNYKRATYELLNIQTRDQVLDAGCGVGIDIRAIVRQYKSVKRVVGVDKSRVMLEKAHFAMPKRLLKSRRVELIQGDLNHLPFGDLCFDSSRADRTLQYFKDPGKALAEIIRVTKYGGNVIIADTNWESLQLQGLSPDSEQTLRTTFLNIIPNPVIGRHLKTELSGLGLKYLNYFEVPIALTGANEVRDILNLEGSLEIALMQNVINEIQVAQSLEEFRKLNPNEINASFNICITQGVRQVIAKL